MRLLTAALAALLCLALAIPAAAAAPTRKQFAARADKICKVDAPRAKRAEKRFKAALRRGDFRATRAPGKLAVKLERRTAPKLRRLSRPPGDQRAIERWIKASLHVADLYDGIVDFVSAPGFSRADAPHYNALVRRYDRAGKRSNRPVRAIPFKVCAQF